MFVKAANNTQAQTLLLLLTKDGETSMAIFFIFFSLFNINDPYYSRMPHITDIKKS